MMHYLKSGVIFLLLIITSCTSSSNPQFYFSGDIDELIIGENELSPAWILRLSTPSSLKNTYGRTDVFATKEVLEQPTLSNLSKPEIISSVLVFESEKGADEYLEYYLEMEKDFSTNQLPCTTPQDSFVPQQKFTYESNLADQFEINCTYYSGDSVVGIFA